MDLIYMNSNKEDVGVMKDYTFDLAFGSGENDFECKIVKSNHCCEAGFFLYCEGEEFGGMVDSIEVDTEAEEITYKGRSWHGILESKILEPDSGEDYLIVSGEANEVLSFLISRMNLTELFKASSEASGITLKYSMNRYVGGYTGIRKMLKASGAKLHISFNNGFVELSAKPIVNYSEDEQFDTDQLAFVVDKAYKPVNHVICLGKGELKEREVIHLYADSEGNISTTQSIYGLDERTAVYDYSNAESSEELIEGGTKLLKEYQEASKIEIDFDAEEAVYDIGDIVGAREFTTGIEVKAEVTKKIITIKDNQISVKYKVGE